MKFRYRSSALIASAAFILSGSLASAADLPARVPVKAPAYVAPHNWTGLYVGGHFGGGWVSQDATFLSTDGVVLDPGGTVYNTNHSGFLGGLQIGYNYQIQNWVIGIGADFAWTKSSVDTVTNASLSAGDVIHSQTKTDWFATLTGRVGYAWNSWLLYAKGGAAWVHQVYGGFVDGPGGMTTYNDISDTRTGWTVGTGLEWVFADKWSLFAEYDYMDFGTNNYTFTAPGVTSNYDIKTRVNVAKLGVNFRF